MTIVFAHGGLQPLPQAGVPGGSIIWSIGRPPVAPRQDERTTDEPKPGVVKVIRVELVDRAFPAAPAPINGLILDVLVGNKQPCHCHLVA